MPCILHSACKFETVYKPAKAFNLFRIFFVLDEKANFPSRSAVVGVKFYRRCPPENKILLIHCTKALASRLGEVGIDTEEENSPLGSWNAHIYTIDRRLCVLFCHVDTRYVVLAPGLIKENFAELPLLFRTVFLQSLAKEGFSESAMKKAALAIGPVRFGRHTDPSVLGTLRLTRDDLGAYLAGYANVLEVDLFELAQWMNSRTLSARKKIIIPVHEMRQLIDGL